MSEAQPADVPVCVLDVDAALVRVIQQDGLRIECTRP